MPASSVVRAARRRLVCTALRPLTVTSVHLSCRVILAGLTIERPKKELARYRMFKHSRDVGNEPNPLRYDADICRGSLQERAALTKLRAITQCARGCLNLSSTPSKSNFAQILIWPDGTGEASCPGVVRMGRRLPDAVRTECSGRAVLDHTPVISCPYFANG